MACLTFTVAMASFVTGATGFIGAEIVRRLLLEPDRVVYALVRASDDRAAAARGREVLFKLFLEDREATAAARRRLRWVPGDIALPGLGLSAPARDEICAECDEVIHSAASTAWCTRS